MEPACERLFLDFSAKKLNQLFERIRDSVARLSEQQVWARASENENAIGNLLLHLEGNLRQWIVHGLGGQPDVRVRDREFQARGGPTAAELVTGLEATLSEAVEIIEKLPPERLRERIRIQGYDLTVLEGIYHVVEHFGQHTGQVVFATKRLTGEDLGFYRHLKAAAHSEKTP
ncbi:MAG: DUF1572 domain-containing protein [Acidobacteria bacterium]|nr:DUF1572 domain-containing protein [Acidobacteriota bacterium]